MAAYAQRPSYARAGLLRGMDDFAYGSPDYLMETAPGSGRFEPGPWAEGQSADLVARVTQLEGGVLFTQDEGGRWQPYLAHGELVADPYARVRRAKAALSGIPPWAWIVLGLVVIREL